MMSGVQRRRGEPLLFCGPRGRAQGAVHGCCKSFSRFGHFGAVPAGVVVVVVVVAGGALSGVRVVFAGWRRSRFEPGPLASSHS